MCARLGHAQTPRAAWCSRAAVGVAGGRYGQVVQRVAAVRQNCRNAFQFSAKSCRRGQKGQRAGRLFRQNPEQVNRWCG